MRVCHIEGAEIDHRRIVHRHVNHARLRGLNANDLALHDHPLLLRGHQVAVRVGHTPQALDAIHHVLWLLRIGLPQRDRPILTLGHQVENGGIVRDGLDRDLPRLLVESHGAVGPHIRGGRCNLIGIRRRDEHLREDRIRIERNRREQVLEFLGGPRVVRRGRREGGILGIECARGRGDAEGEDESERDGVAHEVSLHPTSAF